MAIIYLFLKRLATDSTDFTEIDPCNPEKTLDARQENWSGGVWKTGILRGESFKKGGRRRQSGPPAALLQLYHVLGLKTLGTLGNAELNLIAFVQRLEA
jgi:hypothetical protein